jgi:predicted lipoprotein
MSLTVPGKNPDVSRGMPAIAMVGVAAAVLAAATLLGSPLVTFRPLDPATGRVVFNTAQSANAQGQNQKFAINSFNAEQYVEQQWPSDVQPVLDKNAADLADVLTAIAANPADAAARYGVPHDSNAKNFVVSGTARVAEVNLKSPMGLLTLEFPDSPNLAAQKIQLLTGPLVISTVLRDVASNMSLNAFTNQTQYADVAAALNKLALARTFGQTPAASLAGKTIQFSGVFNLQSPTSIRIVPVSLTVKE